MKTNELRIGNFLHLDGELYKVHEIKNQMEAVELIRKNHNNPKLNEYEECDLDYEGLKPIPLTEYLLLKLGFNTDYKKGYIGIDVHNQNGMTTDFVLSYPQRMGVWQNFFAWEFDNYKFQKIEYLHQLQNFFFCLCEQELVFSSTEP